MYFPLVQKEKPIILSVSSGINELQIYPPIIKFEPVDLKQFIKLQIKLKMERMREYGIILSCLQVSSSFVNIGSKYSFVDYTISLFNNDLWN